VPFTLIKGKFHVVGRAPDGDTIGFAARNKRNWEKLSGPRPRFNMGGDGDITNLRFEAIDTLETHFRNKHQPPPHADGASDFMLDRTGVKNVVWGMDGNGERTRILSADDEVDGYVLARSVERFGRVVAFAFAGTASETDGSSVFLNTKRIKQSVNYKLLTAGLAYPTYYEDMCRFVDLRDTLTAAAVAARKAKKGIWKVDKSGGLTINNARQLETNYVVLPKLFRRYTEYLGTNDDNIVGFKDWLEGRDEGVLVLADGMNGWMTTLDEVIVQNGKKVGLKVKPEELVFKP